MLGVLLTVVFSLGAVGLGTWALRGSLDDDPALKLGAGGLLGLGLLGYLSFPVALLPGGTRWGLWVVVLAAAAGLWLLWRHLGGRWPQVALPKGARALFPAAVALIALLALVSVLAPSDTSDWDTLAYHLAVPKLWIEAGHMFSVPFIHHSNFPFTVDDLNLWGLQWGGESGAKAFQWVFMLLGAMALFGFARRRYGNDAGWWACLAFVGVPVVAWEAGSAYIDVSQGLFAGLGILFAASLADSGERRFLWLSALFLGLAAASKYTGLQTIFAVGLALVVAGAVARKPARGLVSALSVGVVALAICTPWLVRNVIAVGNPVYPFFYEKLGGHGWDQRRADIYRDEQQSFGVGRTDSGRDPSQIGHAVLGLAYNPGRYVNPGQTVGMGSPLGAVGALAIASLMLWLLSGRAGKFEGVCLGSVLVSLAMWFFLSQQSRYAVPLVVPLAVMAGGGVERLKLGRGLAVAAGLQAAVTVVLLYMLRATVQLPVVLGSVSPDDYQAKNLSFYAMSQKINAEAKGGKVALFDEVFGYLLDVPYIWANPGHSTMFPYDSMRSGEDFVSAMKARGVTHIYANLSPLVKDPEFAARWVAAMGLVGPATPLPDKERRELLAEWRTKWEVLLAEAARNGLLEPVEVRRSGVLFKIR